jgi:hypothetical protein
MEQVVHTQVDRKPVSEVKLAANRRNAKRSTGPKTVDGKNKVRLNALKHGLLSRDITVCGEKDTEYRALLSELERDWRPEGMTELLFVKAIADCQWRLLRAHRCENGEILSFRYGESDDERAWRTLIRKRVDFLDSLREELNAADSITDRTIDGMRTLFNSKAKRAFLEPFLAHCRSSEKSGPNQELRYVVSPEQKKRFLEGIEEERSELLRDEASSHECEMRRLEAATSLPLPVHLDSILRYEAAIDRRMHRALEALTRLQQRRRNQLGSLPSPAVIQ